MSRPVTPEYEAAQAWYQAGCTPIPVRLDGTKSPVGEWRHHHTQRLGPEAALGPFLTAGPAGLAIVCGATSGGLEMLEIEGTGIREGIDVRLAELADAAGLRPLLDRVAAGYYESTPKGGVHMFYRLADEPVPGNLKLAERPAREDEWTPAERERAAKGLTPKRTLIETRGQGGYVIVAPTRAEASDPAGPYGQQPWIARWGSPSTIATITVAERRELHALARSMHVAPADRPPTPRPATDALAGLDGDRPGDLFARNTAWPQILEPHGWRRLYDHGGKTYWCRPGKPHGVSATTTDDGPGDPGGLYVFSSSTAFEPEKLYTKFGAHAHLNHGGDMSAAAAALAGPTPVYSDFFGSWQHPAPPAATGQAVDQPVAAPTGPGEPTGNPWQDARDRLYARIRTTATIDDRPLPRYIVNGWLKYDEIGQIIGASGSMKSFAAIDLAAHIATGSTWHGADVQQARVIFVAAEGGSGIRKRIRAWEKRNERRADNLMILDEPVQIATRLGRSGLQASIEWQALAQIIYETKTAVLFVDTQARSTVGINENDNSEMGVVFDAVDQLRRAVRNRPDGHEVTVVLIHHTGKSNGDTGRGAGAMFAAVNTEIRVSKKKVGAEQIVTVTNSKNKDDEDGATLYLTAQVVGLELRDLTHTGDVRQGDEATSSIVLIPSRWRPPHDSAAGPANANPLDDNDRLALVVTLAHEIVGETTQTGLTSLIHAGIVEQRGVNKRTAQRWVAEAVEAKLLKTTSGANSRFTLSPYGRELLENEDKAGQDET
jgi:hypothetical protein